MWGRGTADMQRGTEMEKQFFNDKCPIIHEEMARKNIIICIKNTELKNLGKIPYTLKCKLQNRLRETVQVLEKLKGGGAVVNRSVLLCTVHYVIRTFPNIIHNVI
jgi:hypothetical protein